MTRALTGLREIADMFDAVLVDQFGVLHDGKTAMPGARACLDEIDALGCPIIALTNSGKRASLNAARLARLGFPETLFKSVISSGELAHRRLSDWVADGTMRPGSKVLIIARDNDVSLIDGLPLIPVVLGENADLVLIAGAEPERIPRAAYGAALSPLARSDVPALCANPDIEMYVENATGFGAGLIARDYQEAGGHVIMLGKPDILMFQEALGQLGNPAPNRVLMIGDSPEHDVAGASGAGCSTMLIRGGVQSSTITSIVADFEMDRLIW